MEERKLRQLCAIYDQGNLVPFVGSGMSIPHCVTWKMFVESLEGQIRRCGKSSSPNQDLVQRANVAMRNLRLTGANTAECIRRAVYRAEVPGTDVPPQTKELARLYWPLICTTNYDDVYLQARKEQGRDSLVWVFGRSDADCRQILNHLRFPTREVVWALQGFLRPRYQTNWPEHLERELVVGHAEYRAAANREPHFRRSFAEVFRNYSFLFLGSGLSEPYFLSLFDEIIELNGPPNRPHFAFVESGDLDPEFMRQNYHIECMSYPKGKHDELVAHLKRFADSILGPRVRKASWGYRLSEKLYVDSSAAAEDFKVVRSELPNPPTLPSGHCLAISCGRSGDRPLVGPRLTAKFKLFSGFQRLNPDQVVTASKDFGNTYGIVARGEGDVRSPKVVRTAFATALDFLNGRKVSQLHVQLLAVGPGRTFRPWISLVQMARAYGDWYRASTDNRLSVHLYVVDPSVTALLQDSFLNLAEHLENTDLRVDIDVLRSTDINRHQRLVSRCTRLRELLSDLPHDDAVPRISVKPTVYTDQPDPPLRATEVLDRTVEDMGLVSGSTLVLDYDLS